jgi:hypothetical protein
MTNRRKRLTKKSSGRSARLISHVPDETDLFHFLSHIGHLTASWSTKERAASTVSKN